MEPWCLNAKCPNHAARRTPRSRVQVTSDARNTTKTRFHLTPLGQIFSPCKSTTEALCPSLCRVHTMDLVSGYREPPRSEPIFPLSSQEIPSSPPSVASEAGGGRRQRKPPTVTPRSFRRFFTPRSLLNSGSNGSPVRTSRQALRTLNSPAVNRLGPAFTRSSKPGSSRNASDGLPEDLMRTPSRKRKHSFSSAASPLQSSPLKKVRVRSPAGDDVEQRTTIRDIDVTARGRFVDRTPAIPPKRRPVSPITRSRGLQTSGSLFMRTVQGSWAHRPTLCSTAGAG